MPENCSGECPWTWFQSECVEWWNFTSEINSCNMSCYCVPPEIRGEFNGQVVFTPCQSTDGMSREQIINKIEEAAKKWSQ